MQTNFTSLGRGTFTSSICVLFRLNSHAALAALGTEELDEHMEVGYLDVPGGLQSNEN